MNDKLLMQIGLIDQITKPLQGITKEIQSSMDVGKSGMQDMVTGGAGLVATGFAIQNALMPAIEMDRKIGEVKSLGVTDEALKQLSQTALEFSAEYGKSATEFVAASYDIQSAIAGLDGNELSQFTKASGVLAAATKADTATITSYMGTMYGIFKNQAEEMGKGAWVEDVAGMTASAVQMFKTTGSEMSSAFTSVGANATSAGIAMSEQMAILGTLQATMSGSEAGTKYKSFLAGVGKAQDALNLSFTDSQGKMLPMLDILDKLKGKFGETLDVAESDALKKAFGSDEAVSLIKLLMADTQGLGASMEALGQIKGMKKAEEMAAAMTDQWERLEASWFAIRAAVFGAVLPSVNAVVGSIADNLMWLTALTNEYPLLTECLGYAAIVALSLGGVVASLSLVMGIAKMMSGGWAVTMAGLNGVLKLLSISTLAMTSTAWLFNAALWANPIAWLVIGIGAAIAAIWVFRDYILSFLDGFISGFIEASGVAELFVPLVEIFRLIGAAIGWAFDWVVRLLTPVDAAAESMAGFASAGQLVGKIIGSVFRGILMPIELVINAIRQFINLVNKIPGVNIDFEADSHIEQAVSLANNPSLNAANDPVYATTPSMVEMPTFANMQTQFTPEASNVLWLDPQYRNTAPALKSPELTASVNPQMQPMPTFAPMAASVTPEMQALPEASNVVWLDPQYRNAAPELRNPELTASVNPQIQPMPAFAPMAASVTPEMQALPEASSVVWLDPQYRTAATELKSPELTASVNPQMQPMPTFAPMAVSVTPEMQALPEASSVVWLDPQYKNAAPELSNPELTASVNPQMQPMPTFAPMSVLVTPQMGRLDNTIDTQLIDYKRPERAPQLNKNMVNNMTSSHTKETSNIRQFGDVYITTSASSFDEMEERRELDVG